MRMGRFIAVLSLAFVAFAPRADAQTNCAGFTDIGPDTGANTVCVNVKWLKNRSITLGCMPGLYCPSAAVGRLQMAAFMNRMGNALTPKVYSFEDSGGTLDFSTQHILCETPDLPASMTTYPLTVDANASLSYTINGGLGVNVNVVRSQNGGNWSGLGTGNLAVVETGVRGQTSALVAGEVLPFSPGVAATYKFALSVTPSFGFGPIITSWACHLQVIVRNATYFDF